MKRMVLIILVVFLFTVPCFAAEYREDEYHTYQGYNNGAFDWKIKDLDKAVEHWKEKLEELTVDDVYVFRYEPAGLGGMQKLLAHYIKTKSVLSSAVQLTSSEVFNIPAFKDKGEEFLEEYKNGVISTAVIPDIKETILSNIENIISKNTILETFDYMSEDLKFQVLRQDPYGEFLVITDGEKEIYYIHHWGGDRLGEKFQLFSPGQFLSMLLYSADWLEDPNYYDYTKEVPSTGGSEVVSVAVLCAGASLLGAVAGAVLSRKKGSAK